MQRKAILQVAVALLVSALLPSLPGGHVAPAQATALPADGSVPTGSVAAADGTGFSIHYMPTVLQKKAGLPGAPGNVLPATGGSASIPGALLYGGGPVQRVPHVYLVFWGFSNPTTDDPSGEAAYLQNFFNGISGSAWAHIQTQYYQGSSPKQYITNPAGQFNPATDVWFDNAVTDLPGVLPDVMLGSEAVRAATHFGYSADADYIIATPHLRNTAGFAVPSPIGLPLVGYCAYHTKVSSTFGPVAYTNLPYQTDAPLGICGANFVNPGAAGLLDGVSIVAGHEYAEAVTDPDVATGWIDAAGWENGDKCAWDTTGPGRTQNIVLTTGTFAVQGMWSNEDNGCVIKRAYTADAGGPYDGTVSTHISIAATSTGGTGTSTCVWSDPASVATFGSATSCSTWVQFTGTASHTIHVAMTDGASPAHTSGSDATVATYAALAADAGGPYSGVVGEAVPIAATHTGGKAAYTCHWTDAAATFGNANACSTTAAYTSAATQAPSVTVTDGFGNPASDSASIVVSTAALAANAHGPYSGVQGHAISITGSGSGGSPWYTCSWSSSSGATFGSASACSTTVTYSAAGTDTLTLTVTDAASGTATSTATVTVSSSCANDPLGDTKVPDASGIYDLTQACGQKLASHVEISIATSGLATDNLLGNGVDPVVYRVSFDSSAYSWYFQRVGGVWVATSIAMANSLPPYVSAATGTVTGTHIVLSIPLSETGAATKFSVGTTVAGNDFATSITMDSAPNAGYQGF